MFELYTTGRPRTARTPLTVSVALHVVLVAAIAITALTVVTAPPEVPTILAFVAPLSVPPPPQPPAPAPQPKRPSDTPPVKAVPAPAPIEAPPALSAESAAEGATTDNDVGAESGVAGGVPGGIAGGIVGGIETTAPTPPPPPPLPIRKPVRIGGLIAAPRLLTRVRPVYPKVAARAHIEGLVILEAMVDEDGVVRQVRVLRSVNYLDEPAIEALKQWRYEPLTLNGQRMPFLLTVTMTFSADAVAAR